MAAQGTCDIKSCYGEENFLETFFFFGSGECVEENILDWDERNKVVYSGALDVPATDQEAAGFCRQNMDMQAVLISLSWLHFSVVFCQLHRFLNDKLQDLLQRRSSETEDRSGKPLTHLTTL